MVALWDPGSGAALPRGGRPLAGVLLVSGLLLDLEIPLET